MEIKSNSCRNCVFLGEEDEQKICTLIPYWFPEWVDDDGFDELYQKGEHPKSCPLLKGDITVKLELK